MARMSVSMTLDAVRSRTKTVTRRHANTWKKAAVGDRLTLIEKGMGLPKGAKQVVVAEVELTDVGVEPLGRVDIDEVRAEGLYDRALSECNGNPLGIRTWFIGFWLIGHGYGNLSLAEGAEVMVRRIEWVYLDTHELLCRGCGDVIGILTTHDHPDGHHMVEGMTERHDARLVPPGQTPADPVAPCRCTTQVEARGHRRDLLQLPIGLDLSNVADSVVMANPLGGLPEGGAPCL